MQNNQEATYVHSDGTTHNTEYQGVLADQSAEQKILTNMSFSLLTAESKFVLYAIFQTPGELSQLLFKNKITTYKVKKYLKLMGWSIPTVSKTIRELKIFTNDLLED